MVIVFCFFVFFFCLGRLIEEDKKMKQCRKWCFSDQLIWQGIRTGFILFGSITINTDAHEILWFSEKGHNQYTSFSFLSVEWIVETWSEECLGPSNNYNLETDGKRIEQCSWKLPVESSKK